MRPERGAVLGKAHRIEASHQIIRIEFDPLCVGAKVAPNKGQWRQRAVVIGLESGNGGLIQMQRLGNLLDTQLPAQPLIAQTDTGPRHSGCVSISRFVLFAHGGHSIKRAACSDAGKRSLSRRVSRDRRSASFAALAIRTPSQSIDGLSFPAAV